MELQFPNNLDIGIIFCCNVLLHFMLQFPNNLDIGIIWYPLDISAYVLQFPNNLDIGIILPKIPLCYEGDFWLEKCQLADRNGLFLSSFFTDDNVHVRELMFGQIQ